MKIHLAILIVSIIIVKPLQINMFLGRGIELELHLCGASLKLSKSAVATLDG